MVALTAPTLRRASRPPPSGTCPSRRNGRSSASLSHPSRQSAARRRRCHRRRPSPRLRSTAMPTTPLLRMRRRAWCRRSRQATRQTAGSRRCHRAALRAPCRRTLCFRMTRLAGRRHAAARTAAAMRRRCPRVRLSSLRLARRTHRCAVPADCALVVAAPANAPLCADGGRDSAGGLAGFARLA